MNQPFQILFYFVFTTVGCAVLSKLWVDIDNGSVRVVAKRLRDQQLVIKGHREGTLERELGRYIPTAAILGGGIIGVISVLADITGFSMNIFQTIVPSGQITASPLKYLFFLNKE